MTKKIMTKDEELHNLKLVIQSLLSCVKKGKKNKCDDCKVKNQCMKFTRSALATALAYISKFISEGYDADSDDSVELDDNYFT